MTPAGKATFYRIAAEELAREKARESIGLLAEKRLHSVLKRWVTDDFACHEVRIRGKDNTKRYAVADVCLPDGEIAEIQTGALYPLCGKMEFYFKETNRPVTLIHPVIAEKHVSWISPEDGSVSARRKSPKKETVLSAAGQLKPFAAYFETGRFEVWLPVLRAEEYRLADGWGRGGKRGSHRFELIPTDLSEVVVLRGARDLIPFLPPDLPARFTAKELAALAKPLSGFALYDLLALLCAGGVLFKAGKAGRSTVYEKELSRW